jgi:hypothetical protein
MDHPGLICQPAWGKKLICGSTGSVDYQRTKFASKQGEIRVD